MSKYFIIIFILCSSIELLAFGKESQFRCAVLKHSGSYNIGNSGLKKLLWEVSKRTSIPVSLEIPEVDPENRKQLFKYPFLFLTGQKGITFSDRALNNLKDYLNLGGFLFIDSAERVLNGTFHKSVVVMMRHLNRNLKQLPRNHVIYKTFNLLQEPFGSISLDGNFYGSERGGRLDILYTQNDVIGACSVDPLGGWSRSVSSGENRREMAFRTGVNIVMYSLCLDYKEEQHHIQFLLDQRR